MDKVVVSDLVQDHWPCMYDYESVLRFVRRENIVHAGCVIY